MAAAVAQCRCAAANPPAAVVALWALRLAKARLGRAARFVCRAAPVRRLRLVQWAVLYRLRAAGAQAAARWSLVAAAARHRAQAAV